MLLVYLFPQMSRFLTFEKLLHDIIKIVKMNKVVIFFMTYYFRKIPIVTIAIITLLTMGYSSTLASFDKFGRSLITRHIQK